VKWRGTISLGLNLEAIQQGRRLFHRGGTIQWGLNPIIPSHLDRFF